MHCAVNPDNFLEWEYLLIGAPDTVYAGGVYHGRVRFTKDYPFKPPSILMTTPNGRFEINKRLCLSISDYHPETWNPLWSVSTILLGISSFFYEDSHTAGALVGVSDEDKREFARKSFAYNMDKQTGPKNFQSNFKTFVAGYRELDGGVGVRNVGSTSVDLDIVDRPIGVAPAPIPAPIAAPAPIHAPDMAHVVRREVHAPLTARTVTLGLVCIAVVVVVIGINVAARAS